MYKFMEGSVGTASQDEAPRLVQLRALGCWSIREPVVGEGETRHAEPVGEEGEAAGPRGGYRIRSGPSLSLSLLLPLSRSVFSSLEITRTVPDRRRDHRARSLWLIFFCSSSQQAVGSPTKCYVEARRFELENVTGVRVRRQVRKTKRRISRRCCGGFWQLWLKRNAARDLRRLLRLVVRGSRLPRLLAPKAVPVEYRQRPVSQSIPLPPSLKYAHRAEPSRPITRELLRDAADLGQWDGQIRTHVEDRRVRPFIINDSTERNMCRSTMGLQARFFNGGPGTVRERFWNPMEPKLILMMIGFFWIPQSIT